MEEMINFSEISLENCLKVQETSNYLTINFYDPNGFLYFDVSKKEIEKYKYFIVDVENQENFSVGITFDFCENENNNKNNILRILIGILPKLKTRICIPFEVLNGQTLFLDRTPGRLKAVVQGHKIDISKLAIIKIGIIKAFKNVNVKIYNPILTDIQPEYPLPDIKYVDEFGQLTFKDWTDKTKSEEELKTFLLSELEKSSEIKSFQNNNLSGYGGWKNRKFHATGFFRTEFDGNRWWLVDPEGYAFISIGLDCVNPGEHARVTWMEKLYSKLPEKEGIINDAWDIYNENGIEDKYFSFGIYNLIKIFGQNWWESWAKITKSRMYIWGFNTIGNWTDLKFIKYAKMPYVLPLENFPTTKKTIFRDFPDVFSNEYKENSEAFATQLKQFEDDKYMIGYFLTNEPHWAFVDNLNIAQEMLECDFELASKDAFIDFISKKYNNDIKLFNKSWNLSLNNFAELKKPIKKASRLSQNSKNDLEEFSKLMVEMFCKVPSEETKKVDPNHLNLGMRFAWISSDALYAGSKYFDVFSINCYQMDPYEDIDKISKNVNKPILIGEFHFGALDRGLLATGLRAVKTQEDRGKAYQIYMESGVSHKNFVGAHYFILNDQAVLGRFDGENYQIGIVDVCHKPYKEFADFIVKTNYGLYEVAAGRRNKSNQYPIEIPRVAF
ncbi:beta-galactosidase [Caldicellulosiruptoraceae bacterium PP1]